jgi:hypothetical protein
VAVSHGVLRLPRVYDQPYRNTAEGIALGDVTGDGRDDLIVTRGGNQPSSELAVYAQTPDGRLAPPMVCPAYEIPERVRAVDVDMDGRRDVVVCHGGWGTISVYLQVPGVGLATNYVRYAMPLAANTVPRGMEVADVNNDALPDVVSFGNSGSAVLAILRHTPVGRPPPDFLMHAFPPEQTAVFPSASNRWDIAIAPRNGFAEPVQFALAGLPAGATAWFPENPFAARLGRASGWVAIADDTPSGRYPLTLSAVSSSVTQTARITLIVPDDRDGDRLPDAWEIAWFQGVAAQSATDDPDGDGAPNDWEMQAGTRPMDFYDFPVQLVVAGAPAARGTPVPWGYGTNLIRRGTIVTCVVARAAAEPPGVSWGWSRLHRASICPLPAGRAPVRPPWPSGCRRSCMASATSARDTW